MSLGQDRRLREMGLYRNSGAMKGTEVGLMCVTYRICRSGISPVEHSLSKLKSFQNQGMNRNTGRVLGPLRYCRIGRECDAGVMQPLRVNSTDRGNYERIATASSETGKRSQLRHSNTSNQIELCNQSINQKVKIRRFDINHL